MYVLPRPPVVSGGIDMIQIAAPTSFGPKDFDAALTHVLTYNVLNGATFVHSKDFDLVHHELPPSEEMYVKVSHCSPAMDEHIMPVLKRVLKDKKDATASDLQKAVGVIRMTTSSDVLDPNVTYSPGSWDATAEAETKRKKLFAELSALSVHGLDLATTRTFSAKTGPRVRNTERLFVHHGFLPDGAGEKCFLEAKLGAKQVIKTSFLPHFILKTEHCQDRLGTNIRGNTEKGTFLAAF
jgi:hypothetical protein